MSRDDRFGLALLFFAAFVLGVFVASQFPIDMIVIAIGLSGIGFLIGIAVIITLDRQEDR